MHRIRVAMSESVDNQTLLHGIVEADETYVGGRPRKGNRRDDDTPSPRGRATAKTPVIGMVERGGRVVAKAESNLSGKGITKFVSRYMDREGSLLVTDEYKAYRALPVDIRRAVINHSRSYVDGPIHTNTIEGFWSLVKRAWYGSHHHYSKKYLPLYIAEACYKYNARHKESTLSFSDALTSMVSA